MDRSQDSPNPGMVERQMDETPMEGSGVERENLTRGGTGTGTEREGLQGGGGMERENLSGGEVEREGLQGGGVERDAMTAGDRASENQDEHAGGYGYDRPAEMGTGRDMDAAGGMEATERSGGSGLMGGMDSGGIDRENVDRMDGTTGREGMARDW